ncbi:putative quinol monooxygenase [Pseudochelatococcus sp. B33]
MLYVIASIDLKPGGAAALAAPAADVVAATRAEPGCLSYELFVSLSDPERWQFVERWADNDALAAHFNQPHMKTWREISSGFIEKRHVEIIAPAKVETR